MTRRVLPDRRKSTTTKAVVGGLTVYMNVGEYEDGTPGELFFNVAMAETNDEFRAMLNAFAIACSLAIQHGTPLDLLVKNFVGTRFGRAGPVVGSEHVRLASSVLDWAFREIAIRYLGRDDLATPKG